ncbi:hypothetical protein F5Y00DRAFT_236575 [Daldinia vernicosa]|uniref:uncharacterized protein n=1 Tax=Daldinia vernicosa TaxID=114800 RepID=UPI002007259F|nr:uncharacterized protein F5Y00DRAFT_236575 [Daldinia vernicosa]KAI0849089.1 hypothetical protein F5Y00DRAFT_236575 [Daldinia vernicosa]
MSSCKNVLSDLEKEAKKYAELQSKQHNIYKTAKRVWKRLTWDKNNIHDLRSRIISTSRRG